ncbi:MAG TPA: hypothetical protein VGR03_07040 [Candidatus Acidoferrum sp.]|nr:hypothetical protein [Candidatus Acidoferrum sp.]
MSNSIDPEGVQLLSVELMLTPSGYDSPRKVYLPKQLSLRQLADYRRDFSPEDFERIKQACGNPRAA